MSEQVQSVLVARSLAPNPEAAADVVRSRGYDASLVEETSEGFLFRQAEACDCAPGMVCDEGGCRVTRGPICQCQGKKGSVESGSDKPAREKAMDRERDEDDRPMDDEGEGGEERPAEEEQEMREKVALKAGALWLKGLRAYAKACDDSVEHPGCLKLAKRVTRWGSRTARKYYPKHYKDMGYDDTDDGGESDDEDDEDREKPSDEEKAIENAFTKVMQELFGDRKNHGRALTRKHNGR